MARPESGKVALFDLDGTLADYDGQMRRDLVQVLPPGVKLPADLNPSTMPEWLDNLVHLIRHQPGWWRNLPRYEPGWDLLIHAIEIGFDIHVLTKGPEGQPSAWGEKHGWCHDHLPARLSSVTITLDKSLVYGRVLVDDFPRYVAGWLAARPRGIAIMPAHPWNDLMDPDVRGLLEPFLDRITRYDRTPGALEIVSAAMQAAYDRQTTR